MKVYPGGVRVIEIWPDVCVFVSFLTETLAPVLTELGMPEPKLRIHEAGAELTGDAG